MRLIWTVRASTSGFSVSLYWPNNCESLKKRKRHRKRTKAKSPANYKPIEQADNEILSKEPLEKRASRTFVARYTLVYLCTTVHSKGSNGSPVTLSIIL